MEFGGFFQSKTKVMNFVKKRAFLFILSWFFALAGMSSAYGQQGKVRGTVIDEIGEPLFSASALAKGTGVGATTDFDGKFELSLDPGTYEIQISFIGYNQISITDVKVAAGEVNSLETLKLVPATNELGEVTITAEQVRNTEVALLTVKKKSVNVLDGISSQTFRKIGDADAAAAVTRVPGISVQGGKYVFVRGLGDRYTKTQLNGLDIPGLDPDRNSLQMDIFPTNVIDNILVLKSFTPDLPADFAGGLVNIETAEFPEKPTLGVSASVGYIQGQTFNSNFLTQGQTSSTDWLGFDDGSRSEPLEMGPANPKPTGDFAVPTANSNQQTQQFNSELGAKMATAPLNFGMGLSGGDQFSKGGKTFGYSGSVSYKNKNNYYSDFQQNIWRKEGSDASVYELRPDILRQGEVGINNVFANAMLGGAMKTTSSKYKVNLMHLQNGERTAGIFNESNLISSNNIFKEDVLTYTERSLSNLLVAGVHNSANGKWVLEWKVSPTLSRLRDKDFSTTPYLIEVAQDGDTTFSIDPNEVAFPSKFYRNLSEVNWAGRADAAWEHQLFNKDGKLKFGVGYTLKNRDYEILGYELLSFGALDYTGEPDELLTDEFIYNQQKGRGTFYFGNYQRSNTYSASQSTISAYASEQFQISRRWKAILGLRAEKYDQFYTGQNQAANENPDGEEARIFNNDRLLDLLDLFPSASFIFQANENSNLRLGYFRTTARPSFKEISAAQIADPISGLIFIGNLDLQETDINNLDARYEYFFERGQTVAVSGFFKTFKNPIEIVSFASDNDAFQPRNVGDAFVGGAELEARFHLGFLSPAFEKLSFNGNFSYIVARVAYDKSANGTFVGREKTLREGEELGDFRDMQGQAPYIVNAGISYTGTEGFEAGFFYNVQGPKLEIVGIGLQPDIYSVPFHSLNFNSSFRFGKDDKLRLGISVDNILGDLREQETESFQADPQIFSRYNPGRVLGLSLSYRIQ